MNYRTLADLDRALISLLPRLPRDLDLIVGIPRSGLLAANILALHLNLPLTDVEGLVERRLLRAGPRCPADRLVQALQSGAKVLVLDDSIGSGQAMHAARQRLAPLASTCRLSFAAVYAESNNTHLVDYYAEILDYSRLFSWNLFHHPTLTSSGVDIDGVLCVDPTAQENDDGPNYRAFLAHAQPLFLPSVPVGWLVTSRLEKYRGLTEKWLAQHGVRYHHLLMLDLPDQATRDRRSSHSDYKGRVYRDLPALLFVESAACLAGPIARISGKPVLSIENQRLYEPTTLAVTAARSRNIAFRAVRKFTRIARGFLSPPAPTHTRRAA